MSFDKHSNFNKQANFTEVKFGENKPVLEVELNELQQIQNEARADIVRDTIPSGFTKLGEIDYDFCLNNENQIKFKTESVAYVNGYRINIPKDTIVNIGKAPEKNTRDDLLFLEVWKEEVNSTSELTLEGGEGQVEIPNNIKDSRYPIETTHRVALRWRIRHVADVDFEKYTLDGFTSDSASAVYANINTDIKPQGALDKPIDLQKENTVYWEDSFFNYKMRDKLPLTGDVGVYVCGNKVNRTGAFDGYVYAIPMFRLYRKPSCGKAIPFEYSKINPKVDYSKFAKLVQDEKVERVHAENIKGRSLVNLLKSNIGKMPLTNFNNTFWGREFKYAIELKRQSTYTLILDFSLDANYSQLDSIILGTVGTSDITSNYRLWGVKTGRNKLSFTVPSDFTMRGVEGLIFVIEKTNLPSAPILTIDNFMILEGDWTNKEIPEFFTGLKSLGEDDGNLITIKNGILNDDTYDINDGNQKLLAFSEVTHINSTNTIIPTIEANVIKGEESTPLEKLGSKLETEGHEVIEFTKIKGKTIQNLVNFKDKQYTVGQNIDVDICPTLKLDTWYTILIYVSNNTLDVPIRFSGYLFGAGDGAVFHSDSTFKGDITIMEAKETGLWRGKARLSTLGSKHEPMFTLFSKNPASGSYTASAMVLEGDHMNTPLEELPFVEGIKSVGETEGNIITLHSTGKNIYNGISENTFTTTVDSWYFLDGKAGAYGDMSSKTDTIFTLPKGQYKFNYEGSYIQLCTVDESQSWGRDTLIDLKTDTKLVFRLKNGVGTVSFNNLYIEAGDILTGYEPYVEYTQNIYLREPLRSLPNGVCDEIVGNKVIRRVGKVTYDGGSDESWSINSGLSLTNTFAIMNKIYSKKAGTENFMSDRFFNKYAGCTTTDEERCWSEPDTTFFYVRIAKSKLPSQNLNGFKTWLSQNPLTFYYELATPIEEHLVNVYEKESIKTYQLDAPLRSLPNGVKDEIKDGVLIRRCAEIVYNGVESWSLAQDHKDNYAIFNRVHPTNFDATSNKTVLPDKIINKYVWDDAYNEEGLWFDSNGNVYISIAKSKLDTINGDGFEKYLQSNPIKVVYQCFHYETILTEAKPQNADFSLQRQFGEGNWLREIQEGIKDTVENGKVIRRVGKIVLNGSESWANFLDETTTTYRTRTSLPLAKPSGYGISDRFEFSKGATEEKVKFYITVTPNLSVTVLKSQFPTVESFKTWLSQNPVTVLYELNATTEEALSTDNYMPYPCHDFNTYCGSMYVGQGRNHVVNENKMPTGDVVIIDTPFRSIEGKVRVEDCKYKKQLDGYNTNYIGSSTINVVDLRSVPSNRVEGEYIKFSTTGNSSGTMFVGVYPMNSTSDYISHPVVYDDVFTTREARQYRLLLGINGNVHDDKIWVTLNLEPNTTYYKKVTCEKINENSCRFKDIIISKGNTSPTYVPFVPTTKYIENTEQNDIDDLRHQVSLTGFNYDKILNESFDKLLRGEL